MCECLAYDGGGMFLCEACEPDWVDREERAVADHLKIEELRSALRKLWSVVAYDDAIRDLGGAACATIERLVVDPADF